jgi:hypothetical protein
MVGNQETCPGLDLMEGGVQCLDQSGDKESKAQTLMIEEAAPEVIVGGCLLLVPF